MLGLPAMGRAVATLLKCWKHPPVEEEADLAHREARIDAEGRPQHAQTTLHAGCHTSRGHLPRDLYPLYLPIKAPCHRFWPGLCFHFGAPEAHTQVIFGQYTSLLRRRVILPRACGYCPHDLSLSIQRPQPVKNCWYAPVISRVQVPTSRIGSPTSGTPSVDGY